MGNHFSPIIAFVLEYNFYRERWHFPDNSLESQALTVESLKNCDAPLENLLPLLDKRLTLVNYGLTKKLAIRSSSRFAVMIAISHTSVNPRTALSMFTCQPAL